jgi:glucose-6-phosphate isomerase
MISTKNLFDAGKINKKFWDEGEKKLPLLLTRIKDHQQGFYSIFETKTYIKEIDKIKKFTNKNTHWKNIVVCGIGGSALGGIVLRDALQKNNINFYFLENIDPDEICFITNKINFKETLFIFISKSGETIETVSQYLYFSELFSDKNYIKKDHIVIVTGNKGFFLEESKKNNYINFNIPENIGGRFSVLSAVGLLPASLMGIDIDELIKGAKNMSENFLSLDPKNNISFTFSLASYLSDEPIHVFMPYSTKLRSLGLWYGQLLAESTGKDEKGFTLLPSVGATDQHSQLQLLSDGPQDKLCIFLKVKNFSKEIKILKKNIKNKYSNLLMDKSFNQLLNLEADGTIESLQEKKISNLTINIEKISPYSIGELLFLLQGSTAFLGEMLGINTFNQPGVERSKIITKKLLKQ